MGVTTPSNCSVLLHLVFRYFKWGMNVSFLSNIIPINLYSFTTGTSFRLGSLCSFFFWQKWTHFVFVLENLNPFTVAHLCWFSLVLVAVFAQLYGYILNWNISWDHPCIETHQFQMVIPWLHSLFLGWRGLWTIYCTAGYPLPDFYIWKCGVNANSEFSFTQEAINKLWQSSLYI